MLVSIKVPIRKKSGKLFKELRNKSAHTKKVWKRI